MAIGRFFRKNCMGITEWEGIHEKRHGSNYPYIDEIRSMEFQYLLSGITLGHGAMAVQAVNVPVSIAGMDIAPGEIIHMDENGVCKFPADKLEAVLTKVKALTNENIPAGNPFPNFCINE